MWKVQIICALNACCAPTCSLCTQCPLLITCHTATYCTCPLLRHCLITDKHNILYRTVMQYDKDPILWSLEIAGVLFMHCN